MTTPLVSILIPVFNKEPFVRAAIESALAQTYGNVEVLLHDDGSTDDSLAIARSVSDARLFVSTGKNCGANRTRNRLLGLSRGEFVQFLDADDVIYPEKIARQFREMRPRVDAVFCQHVRAEGDLVSDPQPTVEPGNLIRSLCEARGVTVTALYRAESLRESGGFDQSLEASHEFELHLRLALSGAWREVAVVDEVLAVYRDVPLSVSSDEGRTYLAKSAALQDLLRLDLNESERAELCSALVNAGRHLARVGNDAAAIEAFTVGMRHSSAATDAIPFRLRWAASDPRRMSRLERIDSHVRRRVRRITRRVGARS